MGDSGTTRRRNEDGQFFWLQSGRVAEWQSKEHQ
jgi:hypothetical protein